MNAFGASDRTEQKMPDYHCPNCKQAIRGKTLLAAQSGSKLGRGALACPHCQAPLLMLANHLQIGSTAAGGVALIARLLTSEAQHPNLFLVLSLIFFACILLSGIAIAYFPRFRRLRIPG